MNIKLLKNFSLVVALSFVSSSGFASVVECDTVVSSHTTVFIDDLNSNNCWAKVFSSPKIRIEEAFIERVNVYTFFSLLKGNSAIEGNLNLSFSGNDAVIRHSVGQGGVGPIAFDASTFTFNFADNSSTSNVMTVNGKIVCKDELKVAEVNTDKVNTDTINAKEMTLEMNQAADYVFDDNYKLQSLSDVESFVKENKHLPGVPSAAEFSDKGMNVSEMSNLLLEKVEELTLHMIQMRKEMDLLKEENSSLKAEIKEIKGE